MVLVASFRTDSSIRFHLSFKLCGSGFDDCYYIPVVQTLDCETSQLLWRRILAKLILNLNFMTTSMWSESMFAPLRALTSINCDRSGRGCGRLESARFRGVFVCSWSTCSRSPFVCQQQSRLIGGCFHAGCIAQ
jgi:hypothetical protein